MVRTENVNIPNNAGNTPLHCAVIGECSKITLNALLEGGADPSFQNKEGKLASEYCLDQEKKDLLLNAELKRAFLELDKKLLLPASSNKEIVKIIMQKNPKDVPHEELFKDTLSNNGGKSK